MAQLYRFCFQIPVTSVYSLPVYENEDLLDRRLHSVYAEEGAASLVLDPPTTLSISVIADTIGEATQKLETLLSS